MRVYYVVTDNNPTKRTLDQRIDLKSRLSVRDLEGDNPNEQFQFLKVDASGTRWFGGIDLNVSRLANLAERRKGETTVQARLTALLQAELRALFATGERTRVTVQVVVADDDPDKASAAAKVWLEANWMYGAR